MLVPNRRTTKALYSYRENAGAKGHKTQRGADKDFENRFNAKNPRDFNRLQPKDIGASSTSNGCWSASQSRFDCCREWYSLYQRSYFV